jgi:hypothetical protein
MGRLGRLYGRVEEGSARVVRRTDDKRSSFGRVVSTATSSAGQSGAMWLNPASATAGGCAVVSSWLTGQP